MTKRTRTLANVWLLHQEGRARLGHADAARAWAEHQACAPLSKERIDTSMNFNLVEINLHPEDAGRAVAKWERVAGMRGVCVVDLKDRRPGDRVNEFYDF